MKSFSLNSVELLEYQPNRYPFLMIDEVTKVQPGVLAEGFKNLTNNKLFYYSYERDNLDEIVDEVINLEEDSKNQYLPIIKAMCDKYKNEYNGSAKKICKVLKF